eukprot:TRINITY_DN149_c0_g1_i4.p2 TRINITY_DN149_c0_g1~~TRINITY_DN149_c0_g1_i4.p2  ORF type:complete len:221 (+),score=75.06 TRINITY_DN149_c0_g1_i4:624-1286(+)
MRMNGVNPLCFHYNFTEKNTRKYGREHQVSNDLFNKELKGLIAPIYQTFPERFYDALQLAHPKVLDKCDEKRWLFMQELFYMTARPQARYYYIEAPKAPPPRPPPRSTERATTLHRPHSQPVFDIIDYDAARKAGALRDLPSHTHTIYVGTNSECDVELSGSDPQSLCMAVGVLATRHASGGVRIHCQRALVDTIQDVVATLNVRASVLAIPNTRKKSFC